MKTLKGPAIFLAQFASDTPPFNALGPMAQWVASLGYKGVQIPSWDRRLFDLDRAAESKTYCDELIGNLAAHGLSVTELSTHLQGQLVAVHPAYDTLFDAFAPQEVHGKPAARQEWAVSQLLKAARASANLGLRAHATFSGALAWPYVYPWPQRPPGLIETAFDELAKRWKPILDAFDQAGVDVCYEIHPGEDLHDGATFEMFLARVGDHPRCKILVRSKPFRAAAARLSRLHRPLSCAHRRVPRQGRRVQPDGRQGVYGGYPAWVDRAGRFRSLGDGQVDFRSIFSKLSQYGFDGWAVLEWECCLKYRRGGRERGRAVHRPAHHPGYRHGV